MDPSIGKWVTPVTRPFYHSRATRPCVIQRLSDLILAGDALPYVTALGPHRLGSFGPNEAPYWLVLHSLSFRLIAIRQPVTRLVVTAFSNRVNQFILWEKVRAVVPDIACHVRVPVTERKWCRNLNRNRLLHMVRLWLGYRT